MPVKFPRPEILHLKIKNPGRSLDGSAGVSVVFRLNIESPVQDIAHRAINQDRRFCVKFGALGIRPKAVEATRAFEAVGSSGSSALGRSTG